jgi:hypothetical protein
VGLFKRRRKDDDQQVDPEERSPQLGLKYKDLAVLGSLVDHGADLTQPRHVLYFLYLPDRQSAEQAGAVAEGQGWSLDVREPLPQYPGSWCLVCSQQEAVTSPDFVREADDFFTALASAHGGEYDGWEASV